MTLFIGSLCNGGAERVISGLANHLSKENEITLLTVSDLKPEYQLDQDVSWETLDKGTVGRLKKNIYRVITLIQYVRRNKADTYIAFLPVTSYLILCLRYFIKGKIIISIRNDPKEEYRGGIHRILVRFLFPLADGVVFQTEDEKEYFNEKVIKSYRVIPNPLSKEFLEFEAIKCRKEKRIISVGRLAAQKNFKMLIEAFSLLVDQYPDYYLVIFGEGSERGALEQLIRDKGIEAKCFLPGRSDDILTELCKSELFVSTSDYEGISNALLEAMACGLPSITTDWSGGGARILVENEVNGIVIPVQAVDRLVQEMTSLLSDVKKRERLSEKAMNVKINFSPEAIYQLWEEYIWKIFKS